MSKLSKQVQILTLGIDSLAENGGSTLNAGLKIKDLDPLVGSIEALLKRVDAERDESLELLAANRLLAREMRRIYSFLDSLNIGFLIVDNVGKIQFANVAMKPFLNLDPADACGQIAPDAIRDDTVLGLLSSAGEAGATRWTGGIELEEDSETGRVDTAVTLNNVVDSDGESVGQVLIYQPITQVKNMEKIQTQFVDQVAHELRTPLTSIRAYVEMLIDGETTDKQMQYDFYNVIYEETYRLSQLIDNLLNISMMESGMAKLDASPTRLKRLLEEAVDVVRPQCEKKEIELVVDLDDRLPTFDIDKSLFNVAILNIVGNAVKYTPEKGNVVVTTSSHDEEYCIHVRDSGPGIAEDELSRIFEKFYRSASTESEQGSGVGLATARQIVRLHGGEVRVTSKLGEGSEFVISLPRTLINTSIGS